MRIAIVSDIHGNLLALDAVMTDLERYAPDEVWCGGDIAWGGPWASECIARVRDAGWTTIKGNTDIWITGDPQGLESDEQRGELQGVAAAHDISKDEAEWLINLPLGHHGAGSILLVHGTPRSPFKAPLPCDPASEFRDYEGQATVVVYGHVHHSFVRRLSDGTVVANAGSVGLPLDGLTACYMLIDQQGPEWCIRHRRVPFDRRAGLAQARTIGGPVGERFLKYMEMAESESGR
ncbi:MAG: metallophosphatase family protein [Actinomycetota bacterium]|nr:metallophosphatase family protein [Actinomycetota bacterium]